MKKYMFTKTKRIRNIVTAGVCCVFAIGISVGVYASVVPASYVSMDVNPSIEYTLNVFDRVLSVRAVNHDGENILQDVDLADFNHKTIDEAIRRTLNEITAKGYFNGDSMAGVVIATSGKESAAAENLAEHLKEIITTQFTETNYDVSVETVTVNQSQLDEAKALGVTPGKLLLVQELQAENYGDVAFVTEEWLTKSVKEIMAESERLDALEDAKEVAEEAAEDAEESAQEAAEDAGESAQESAEDAKESAQEAAEDAKEAEDIKKDAAEASRDAAEKRQEVILEAAEKQKDAEEKAEDLSEESAEEAEDAAKMAAEASEEAVEKANEVVVEASDQQRDAEEKAKDLAQESQEAAAEAGGAAEQDSDHEGSDNGNDTGDDAEDMD